VKHVRETLDSIFEPTMDLVDLRHVHYDGVDRVASLRFEGYRVLRLDITWRGSKLTDEDVDAGQASWSLARNSVRLMKFMPTS